jgi:hypothetical protein
LAHSWKQEDSSSGYAPDCEGTVWELRLGGAPVQLRHRTALVDLRTAAQPRVLLTNLTSLVVGFALYAQSLIIPQSAERRAQSAERRAQSAERRAQSAERRARLRLRLDARAPQWHRQTA